MPPAHYPGTAATPGAPRHAMLGQVLKEKKTWSLWGQIINGAPASSVNPATLRNPECLAEYVQIGATLRAEVA